MKYDIDCPCGATVTRCGMNESKKLARPKDNKVVTHRPCNECNSLAPQVFRTAPPVHIDAPSGGKPFKVSGMDGTFTSRKQVERQARALNHDLTHTSGDEHKRRKARSNANAEALAAEMGYSSLNEYKTTMRDPAKAAVKLNETLERQGKPRT